jgi:hypothetical protein
MLRMRNVDVHVRREAQRRRREARDEDMPQGLRKAADATRNEIKKAFKGTEKYPAKRKPAEAKPTKHSPHKKRAERAPT